MASSRLFPQLILVPSNSSSAHLKTHPRLIQNFSTTQLDLSPAHSKIKTLLPFICVKCKDIVGDKVQSDFIVPQFLSFYFKYVSRFPSVSKEANIKIIIPLDFRHLDSYPTVTHAFIPFPCAYHQSPSRNHSSTPPQVHYWADIMDCPCFSPKGSS